MGRELHLEKLCCETKFGAEGMVNCSTWVKLVYAYNLFDKWVKMKSHLSSFKPLANGSLKILSLKAKTINDLKYCMKIEPNLLY